MTSVLQNLIVIALVAACALAMGLRAYRVVRGRKTGCGCDHCPVSKRTVATRSPDPSSAVTSAPPAHRGA